MTHPTTTPWLGLAIASLAGIGLMMTLSTVHSVATDAPDTAELMSRRTYRYQGGRDRGTGRREILSHQTGISPLA